MQTRFRSICSEWSNITRRTAKAILDLAGRALGEIRRYPSYSLVINVSIATACVWLALNCGIQP